MRDTIRARTSVRGRALISFILAGSLALLLAGTPANSFAISKRQKLNIKKLNMTVGSEFRLRVYNLKKKQKTTFTSTNDSVASVDSAGTGKKCALIRAVGIGTARIRVVIRKGKKVVRRLKCRIRVSPSGVSIKFIKRTVHMPTDASLRPETIIKPNTSMEQPVFESDNPDVATVNSRGIVTALSPGSANITATLLSADLTAVCTVIVEEDGTVSPSPGKHFRKWSQEPLENTDTETN